MKKQDRKRSAKSLYAKGWTGPDDSGLFSHRSLSPEGVTIDVAIILNQDKKIDPLKLMKQIMRKGG